MIYKKTKFTWSAYAYRYSLPSTTILLWPHITTPISWIIPNLKKIITLQTSSFKCPNVHHHLHMNLITIHLDDLLLYTMCIYKRWSKKKKIIYEKGLNISPSKIWDLCLRLVGWGNMLKIMERLIFNSLAYVK
jgi:hypothetical protein